MRPTGAAAGQTGQGVGRNALFLLIAKAVTIGLGFFMVVYLARTLGDENYGKYVFAGAYTSFFMILSDLGLGNLTTRHLARDKASADAYLGTMVALRLCLALVSLGMAYLILVMLRYPPDIRTIVCILLIGRLLIGTFGFLYVHVFEGYEQMQYITLLDSLKKATDLFIAVGVLSLGFGLVELMIGFVASETIHLAIAWGFGRYRLGIRVRPTIQPGQWGPLIRAALPFALLLAFMTVLMSTDIVMLEKMRSDVEVGWYGAATRLVSTLSIIPMMVGTAMFPAASRLYRVSIDEVRHLFLRVLRPLLLVCIPVGVGTSILALDIVFLLYGLEYLPASDALRILIWSAALNFLTLPMIFLLTATDRQTYGMYAMGASALVNVACNLILIPRFGITGAAVTTVASQIVLLCCCLPVVVRLLPGLALYRYFIHPVLGSLCMGLIVWYAAAWPVMLTICLGAVVYAGVLTLTGGLKRQDFQNLREMLNPAA